jgi:hypothetical protein
MTDYKIIHTQDWEKRVPHPGYSSAPCKNCNYCYCSDKATGYEARESDDEYSCKKGGFLNCIHDDIRNKTRETVKSNQEVH